MNLFKFSLKFPKFLIYRHVPKKISTRKEKLGLCITGTTTPTYVGQVCGFVDQLLQACLSKISCSVLDNEDDETPWLPLPELPLFSLNLTRLELYVIKFSTRFTHFSSCPTLPCKTTISTNPSSRRCGSWNRHR